MLPEQLPGCICDRGVWITGSAIIGCGTQQWFTCNYCNKVAVFLLEDGGNAFLNMWPFTNVMPCSEWVNDVLMVTWRANAAKIKEARDLIEARYWDLACRAVQVPPKTPFYRVPDDKQDLFRRVYDGYMEDTVWQKPEGVEFYSIPPRIPNGIAQCFIQIGEDANKPIWKQIKHQETAELPLPIDPIRVQHDAYFGEVFGSLRKELGVEIVTEEIPNQFTSGWKPQPWFKFMIGDNTFVVGPRKRVDAILVQSLAGFQTTEIRKVALDEDKVTYSPDGRWHGKADTAKTLEVHAWTQEKLIQYLTILGKASLVKVG